MTANVGDEFQKNTKHSRGRLIGSQLDWSNKPETYKKFPTAPAFELPKEPGRLPFADVLKNRKSVRSFSNKPLSVEDLSFLLWASTGIQRTEQGYEFRTTPSAGALYPIETYLIATNVDNLGKGLYHYDIQEHKLDSLKAGDFGHSIAKAALGQLMCLDAPVVFIWTGICMRSKWKYGQRAYRYMYLEAGHIAQNLALATASKGLGSCQIGAFFDDEINDLLGIDGTEESVLYLSVVGHIV
jgi:SagB-type dehydrogenase family enzyme